MGSLWSAAVLTYGVGDVVTTHLGLQQGQVHEAHPLSQAMLEMGGLGGMLAVKAAVIAAFYLLATRVIPREIAVGVPIGLTVVGSLVTLNNLTVLTRAQGMG